MTNDQMFSDIARTRELLEINIQHSCARIVS